MAHDSIWIFVNSQNPSQKLELLGLKSAREFAGFLRRDEIHTWHVQEKGEQDFQTVARHPAFLQNESPIAILHSSTEQRSLDKRNQKRVSAACRVTLYSDDAVFHSTTKNVSAGGLELTDKVPENFHLGPCRIVIDSGDNLLRLEFVGRVLSAHKSGSRIKFEGEAREASLQNFLSFMDTLEGKKRSNVRLLKTGS